MMHPTRGNWVTYDAGDGNPRPALVVDVGENDQVVNLVFWGGEGVAHRRHLAEAEYVDGCGVFRGGTDPDAKAVESPGGGVPSQTPAEEPDHTKHRGRR